MHRSIAVVILLSPLVCTSSILAQTVSQMLVRHKTSTASYAATNSAFQLVIKTSSSGTCTRDFPSLPHNEREKGETDNYTISVSGCGLPLSQVTPASLYVRTLGTNAWLPATF